MKCKTCECESKYPYHEGCAKKANTRLEILSTESGDWCATYNADTGECLHQGHQPDWWLIAEAIGVEIIETPEGDHYLDGGQFPDKLPS